MSAVTALDGAAAVHIDAIVRDCLAARMTGPRLVARLIATADFAEILEPAS